MRDTGPTAKRRWSKSSRRPNQAWDSQGPRKSTIECIGNERRNTFNESRHFAFWVSSACLGFSYFSGFYFIFLVCLVFQQFDLWQPAEENGLAASEENFHRSSSLGSWLEVFEPTNWTRTMDGLLSAVLLWIPNWWADFKADLFVGCKLNQVSLIQYDLAWPPHFHYRRGCHFTMVTKSGQHMRLDFNHTLHTLKMMRQ